MTGLGKGMVGIAVRPAIGMFELVSKGTHGMGLVCLGREAITGSAQRRVRAPGAIIDEQAEVGYPACRLTLVFTFKTLPERLFSAQEAECFVEASAERKV